MNMPCEMGEGRVICCGICKEEFEELSEEMLKRLEEEEEEEKAEIEWEKKNS
jgi:hypothetical protein